MVIMLSAQFRPVHCSAEMAPSANSTYQTFMLNTLYSFREMILWKFLKETEKYVEYLKFKSIF